MDITSFKAKKKSNGSKWKKKNKKAEKFEHFCRNRILKLIKKDRN